MASEIEAAERYGRFMAMQMGATEHADYCMGQMCTDRDSLARWAVARLAADRAEREERAKPIDAEWLSSIFDEEFDEAFSSRSIMLGVLVPACGRCGWTWVVGDVHVATVTTRGQLLDLLRVLKGGAE